MQNIESDVTGKVWKLQAQVGDLLQEDDIILIIESMKMEIPVQAPSAGRLDSIRVEEGEQVQEGQLLATLDP